MHLTCAAGRLARPVSRSRSAMTRAVILFSFLLLVASGARGQSVPLAPVQHGGYHVEVPRGWAAQADAQGALLLASPERDAHLHLRIRPYAPVADPDAALAGVLAGSAAYDEVARATSDNGEGRLWVVRLRDGTGRAAVLVDPDPARGVTVLGALSAAPERFDALGGPALLAAVTNSVRPLAASPPPEAPAASQATRARVLAAHYLEPFNPTTGSGGWRIRTLTLFPDGTFYGGPLAAPPEAVDLDALRRRDPQRVGTWREDGATLRLHYTGLAGTRYEHVTLQREGDGWRRSRNQLFRDAQPVRRLRGHYRAEQSRTAGAHTGAPVVSAASSDNFWFHADGRFERTLRAGASGGTTTGGGVATREQRVGGTYALRGLTLTLRHDDGTVQHLAVGAWPEGDAVVIGAKRFERQ